LNEINELFTEYDTDGSGSLELEEFKNVVKRALKIEGRVC
jgi:Ca2+-binding EF-hand superfamily protein